MAQLKKKCGERSGSEKGAGSQKAATSFPVEPKSGQAVAPIQNSLPNATDFASLVAPQVGDDCQSMR